MTTEVGDGAGQRGTAHDVAVQVLRFGPLPRSRVARLLGLSSGSLTRLSKPLIDEGFLVETPAVADPESRRPTRPLDVAAERHRFVGVNVSALGAWAVLTDLRTEVLATARVDLPGTSPADVVRAVASLVVELTGDGVERVDAVGLSLGGHVEGTGLVRRAAFLEWDVPVPLDEMLEEACGAPVVVGNDLAALTRSEHWFGEGRTESSFAVVTVGAGVGYGLVLRDSVVETPDTGLQLLGHFPLAADGLRCPQGHRGCATAVLTLPAVTSTASFALGRQVTFEETVATAAAGDLLAASVLDDAARHLGTLLAAVANISSVDLVVLAGEGVDLARVSEVAMHDSLRAHRDPEACAVRVVRREHDFFAWARGAAGMAVHSYVTGPRWLTHDDRSVVGP